MERCQVQTQHSREKRMRCIYAQLSKLENVNRHNVNLVVTGGTEGFHDQNLRCHHWQQSWHHGQSWFSVMHCAHHLWYLVMRHVKIFVISPSSIIFLPQAAVVIRRGTVPFIGMETHLIGCLLAKMRSQQWLHGFHYCIGYFTRWKRPQMPSDIVVQNNLTIMHIDVFAGIWN